MITVGHFFAGGGGGILAAEILGHESVFALEIDPVRCRVLRESEWWPAMHVECADIREFDPHPWKGRMDCISAGFPCQDISPAGPGAGIKGKRSGLIWPLLDAVDVIRPGLVFLENSPQIRTKGRREIIERLVASGYSWRDGTLAAAHVGAGHLRNRWWCLAANAEGMRKLEQERCFFDERQWFGDSVEAIGDSDEQRLEDPGPSNGRRESYRDQPPAVAVETLASHSIEARLSRTKRSKMPSERRPKQLPPNCTQKIADPDEMRRNRRPGNIVEAPGWAEFANRLERVVEVGSLENHDAEAIAVAAAYTQTFSWLPVDAGIRRVVDGLADKLDISKKARIAMIGDGQVPLQAVLAWCLLAHPLAGINFLSGSTGGKRLERIGVSRSA